MESSLQEIRSVSGSAWVQREASLARNVNQFQPGLGEYLPDRRIGPSKTQLECTHQSKHLPYVHAHPHTYTHARTRTHALILCLAVIKLKTLIWG